MRALAVIVTAATPVALGAATPAARETAAGASAAGAAAVAISAAAGSSPWVSAAAGGAPPGRQDPGGADPRAADSGAADSGAADPGVTARGEPIVLGPALADPERQARLAAWWRELEAARPALSVVTVRLRRARARWREGATREGCSAAQRALAQVDGAALRRAADFAIVLEIGTALDEFGGAAAACLERRYFEFDYRLQLAEAALAAAGERAAAELARPGG